MKVLILSSKFPYPLKDGGAIASYQIFAGLSKLADKVHILSFNTSKHFVKEDDIDKTLFPENSFSLINHNTDASFSKALKNLIFSKQAYILERFTSSKFNDKLVSLLKNNDFDIVQIEGLYMLQYIDSIRKYSEAKIAYRSHNIEHKIWLDLSKKSSNIIRKVYFKILSDRILRYEKFCVDKYDMILPITENDADYYRKLSCKKSMLIVPTGFDFENLPYRKSTNTNRKKLFYIGSLEWLPNQEGLLWFVDNCWKKLLQYQSDIELYVAGRNAPKSLEKKLLKENIKFVGEIASSQEFMRDKSIMIVPLFSGSGMRIKIAEAFINGKAVVSSKAAIKGIEVIDNKHILISDNCDNFIKNILKLINNKSLYDDIVKSAFLFAKNNFDNSKIIKNLYEFYKKIPFCF